MITGRALSVVPLFAVMFFCIASFYLWKQVYRVDVYIPLIDTRLSGHIRQAIDHFIVTANQSPNQFIAELKHRFPMLNSAWGTMKELNTMAVTAESAVPFFYIGDSFVLTQDGRIFLATCFSERALQKIPHIALVKQQYESPEDVPLELRLFAHSLPKHIYHRYDVRWNNKNDITLHNRVNQQLYIRMRADQQQELALLAQAESLLAREAGKRKQKMTADIRFRKQVIIS